MNIYSLFDRKLKEFGNLLLANNDQSIRRSARDGIPGSGTMMEKHPADFEIRLLGTFDMDTGQIVPEEIPVLLDGLDVILGDVLAPPVGGIGVSPQAGGN